MDDKVSRRSVLKQSAGLAALAMVGSAACGKEKKVLSCMDTSALAPADLQTRTTLAYVDRSMDPTKICQACKQFIPAAPHACGSCKIIKGPINPIGNCKSFAAKAVG